MVSLHYLQGDKDPSKKARHEAEGQVQLLNGQGSSVCFCFDNHVHSVFCQKLGTLLQCQVIIGKAVECRNAQKYDEAIQLLEGCQKTVEALRNPELLSQY